jgi:MoxR-like ATPase
LLLLNVSMDSMVSRSEVQAVHSLTPADLTPADAMARFEALAQSFQAARAMIERAVLGQSLVVEQALITLLAGGHGLLVGVPGVAKTTLVKTIGTVLGLETKRVQFTPDLMPADILGSEVLETNSAGQRAFRFIQGPVFCQLLMADEINRASPRTQSALLEAMQEQQVSVAGQPRALASPFHVLATQNPIEQDGTYPLPEAQLDRFLLDIRIDYPDLAAERAVLLATTSTQLPQIEPVLEATALEAAQNLLRHFPTPEHVAEAILRIVRALRPSSAQADILWGAGPRAAQALLMGARARALLHGRSAPLLEDVVALAPAVLRHRIALSYQARAKGLNPEALIAQLINTSV